MHEPVAALARTPDGTAALKPNGDPLFFSRILAIVSHYDVLTSTTAEHPAFDPQHSLSIMWNKERWRFDPYLLAAFAKTVGTQPTKPLAALSQLGGDTG